MRGADERTGELFSYVDIEERVPQSHPLRLIRRIVNDVLSQLDGEFAKLYADDGRPSIAPERLLRALLLQGFYTIRSERQLMEQLHYNLLYRWFVGLGVDDPVWVPTVFSKNATGCSKARWRASFWPSCSPGLAKNDRLIAEIKTELDQAAVQSRRTGKPARRFKDFRWTTRCGRDHVGCRSAASGRDGPCDQNDGSVGIVLSRRAVRRGLIQLAWRFLLFQRDSVLAQWFRSRTEGPKAARKTKMVVALARKLLVALWRMVTFGEIPQGVVLRQAI